MFDRHLRPLIDPPLNAAARLLVAGGLQANAVTLAGAVVGVAAGLAIAGGHFGWGLAFIVLNRLLDGLDGALARQTQATDFGGYLDAICDYIFYVAVPLGFAAASPQNLWPALLLIASFVLTAVSFLAFAALAAKRGITSEAQGPKSFYYAAGLAEGAETIAVFVAFCLWPHVFGLLATAFAALCLLSVAGRIAAARSLLAD
tara:strand:+ start:15763 stop:16368 length:606 start_codon:yes stop_codon:yes gene_type:complete